MDDVAAFARVLTSRTPRATAAHREALERCAVLASAFAARAPGVVAELNGLSCARAGLHARLPARSRAQ
jgi:hypothetical protein